MYFNLQSLGCPRGPTDPPRSGAPDFRHHSTASWASAELKMFNTFYGPDGSMVSNAALQVWSRLWLHLKRKIFITLCMPL